MFTRVISKISNHWIIYNHRIIPNYWAIPIYWVIPNHWAMFPNAAGNLLEP